MMALRNKSRNARHEAKINNNVPESVRERNPPAKRKRVNENKPTSSDSSDVVLCDESAQYFTQISNLNEENIVKNNLKELLEKCNYIKTED